MTAKTVLLVALIIGTPVGVWAQNQTCPTTLSYTPGHPEVGQPVTLTLNYYSPTAPGPNSGTQIYPSIAASAPGSFDYQYPQETISYISNIPGFTSLVFTPDVGGTYTASGSFQAGYDFDSVPLCQAGYAPSITFQVSGPVGPNPPVPNTRLLGPYAFLFHGSSTVESAGITDDTRAVGSLMADGAGNITGEEDLNMGGGVFQQVPVTGTYTLHDMGTGTLTLKNGSVRQHFDIFSQGSPADQAVIVETDGAYLTGQGTLLRQDAVALAPPASGGKNYVLNLTGEQVCVRCVPASAPKPVTVGGVATFSPGVNSLIAGNLDETVGTSAHQNLPLYGVVSDADISGRFTFQVPASPETRGNPVHFVGYVVDAAHFLMLSTEPYSSSIVLSGEGAASTSIPNQ